MTITLDQLMTPDQIAKAEAFAISVNPANGGSDNGPLNFYVVNVDKKWPNGTTFNVIIDNRSSTPSLTQEVKKATIEWMKYANLRFKFTETKNWDPATRTAPVHMWVVILDGAFNCNSSVGTNCQYSVETLKRQSMNLTFGTETDYQRSIIHELGHAIGLEHEHLNRNVQIPWDKEAVYADQSARCGWTKAKVDFNIFDPLKGNVDVSDFDKDSIMCYSIPKGWVKASARVPNESHYIPPAKELSARDKQGVSRAYPGSAYVVSGTTEYLFRTSGKEILRMTTPFDSTAETSWVKNDALTSNFNGLVTKWGWLFATDQTQVYKYAREQKPDPLAKPTIVWTAPTGSTIKYIEQDADALVITLSDETTSRILQATAAP